jgi:hypothetical protein
MMSYPEFYDNVEKIELYDPLAEFLGSFDEGKVTIKYINIVKLAGHSCPTVAGAYLITKEALKALYPDSTPTRGEIKVEFKEDEKDGVAGVIANVISNITGATEHSGFKGLNGKYARHSLMSFNSNTTASARFTRVDTGESVEAFYDPSGVPASPDMQPLMGKMMKNLASDEEKKLFGKLWQKRVQEILINTQNYPNLLKIS